MSDEDLLYLVCLSEYLRKPSVGILILKNGFNETTNLCNKYKSIKKETKSKGAFFFRHRIDIERQTYV